MKTRLSIKKPIIVAIALLGLVSPTVFSRGVLDYSMVLPRIGSTTTGSIVKVTHSRGVNRNDSTGDGKTLNTSIRNYHSGSDITPTYSLPSGARVLMSYHGSGSHYVNETTTLGLATQFGNTVRVQTTGSWSPDEEQ
ncbi:TPA: hypothetical protein U1Y82_001811 [Streptococcus suis]|nr:hypothetical protein [Streptococcus suis]